MYLRYLPIVLLGLLTTQPAMTQAPREGAAGQQQYRLTGVMVSDTRRTALLNGRVVHEGARIGGALIESIDQREIRVRIGSDRRVVRVGHFFTAGPSEQPAHGLVVVTRSKPDAVLADASRTEAAPTPHIDKRYTVVDGDTLSGIALRHRPDGATMNQVMIALFNANPDAFLGNLNRLRSGVTLLIPDSDAMQRVEPAQAMAQVLDHHEQWRGDSNEPAVYVASSPPAENANQSSAQNTTAKTLGPVQQGDTLSEIAQAVSAGKADITTAQVMVALYEMNPDAFGPSMNVLYEGAVLTLPADSELAARSDAAASLEVQRQVAAWGHDPPLRRVDDQTPDFATIASAGLPAARDYLAWRWESPH